MGDRKALRTALTFLLLTTTVNWPASFVTGSRMTREKKEFLSAEEEGSVKGRFMSLIYLQVVQSG